MHIYKEGSVRETVTTHPTHTPRVQVTVGEDDVGGSQYIWRNRPSRCIVTVNPPMKNLIINAWSTNSISLDGCLATFLAGTYLLNEEQLSSKSEVIN